MMKPYALRPTFLIISTQGFSPLLLLTEAGSRKRIPVAKSHRVPRECCVRDNTSSTHGQVPQAPCPWGSCSQKGDVSTQKFLFQKLTWSRVGSLSQGIAKLKARKYSCQEESLHRAPLQPSAVRSLPALSTSVPYGNSGFTFPGSSCLR